MKDTRKERIVQLYDEALEAMKRYSSHEEYLSAEPEVRKPITLTYLSSFIRTLQHQINKYGGGREMKVLKNGKYKGEFTIKCLACGCEYRLIGPFEFIFSEACDDDTLYDNNDAVATTHSASTKCPQCLYVQRYSSD